MVSKHPAWMEQKHERKVSIYSEQSVNTRWTQDEWFIWSGYLRCFPFIALVLLSRKYAEFITFLAVYTIITQDKLTLSVGDRSHSRFLLWQRWPGLRFQVCPGKKVKSWLKLQKNEKLLHSMKLLVKDQN